MTKDQNMDLYFECRIKSRHSIKTTEWCNIQNAMIEKSEHNRDWKEWTPRLKYAEKEMNNYVSEASIMGIKDYYKIGYRMFRRIASDEEIYKYLGRIPFNPCVMLNISPAWKGELITKDNIEGFQRVIEGYLGCCGRYTKWKYVLESGGEGNFLHAHIVAEINPDVLKSVVTHINNGNHAEEIKKLWKKAFPKKWSVDLVKGKFAIQRILIREEKMRDDKLAYLIEENKPVTHKNKYDLGILKNRGF